MSTPREIIADVAFRNLGKPVDKIADAALAALTEAGWQVVPVEPTEEMQNAARDWSIKKNGQGVGHDQSRGCYQAMIAAAPSSLPPPPAKQGG